MYHFISEYLDFVEQIWFCLPPYFAGVYKVSVKKRVINSSQKRFGCVFSNLF